MDPLEYAIRRYGELATPSDGFARYQPSKLKDLQHWLQNDVCQAVNHYLHRAKFQQEASWAVRNLTKGAESNERKAIEEVENALVDAAIRLLAIVSHSVVQQHFRVDPPPQPRVITEHIEGSSTVRELALRETEANNLTTLDLVQLRQISNHFWNDLAFDGDYFAPRGGLHGLRQRMQYGEFTVSLNRALPTLGDMISACLLQRLDLFYSELKRFRNKCISTLRNLSPSVPEILRECETVLDVLDMKVGTLKALVQINTLSPRSACIALTQLFLMFNPGKDVSWLGLDEQTLLDPPSLRAHLTNQRNTEFYDSVAVSLGQLKLLYQNEPANQSVLEEAISTGGLVIHEPAKTVYWESKTIDFAWHKHAKLWHLLITLARATRLQQSVNDRDVYGDSDDPKTSGALAQLVSRLKRELPASLRGHVTAVQSAKSYRLDLANDRVHIIH